MAKFSVWIIEASNLSVSGGKTLDAVTQDGGSHLLGETITLLSDNWLETTIRDDGGDKDHDNDDTNQLLDGDQTIDGATYFDGTRVEAGCRIMLEGGSGNTYEALAFKVNNSTPPLGKVKGLAFAGPPRDWPQVGTPLSVTSAKAVNPGGSDQADLPEGDLVVSCFTPGTLIATPQGSVPVEMLEVGDLVDTLDDGRQAIRWVGHVTLGPQQLAADPALRPIRVQAGALGTGCPDRDILLCPQHRILLNGWRAELHFGEPQALGAVRHLVNHLSIAPATDVENVTYVHLLFDQHEIIFADGLAAESFLPGPMTFTVLPEETRDKRLSAHHNSEHKHTPPMPSRTPANEGSGSPAYARSELKTSLQEPLSLGPYSVARK